MCKASQIDEGEAPVQEVPTGSKMEAFSHFSTLIYHVKAPQFLDTAKTVVSATAASATAVINTFNPRWLGTAAPAPAVFAPLELPAREEPTAASLALCK